MPDERPLIARIHHRLGQTLAWWGWQAGASRACRDALAAAPELVEARLTLGESLMRRRRWLEAAAAFGEIMLRRPGDVEALGNLVLALGRAGRWDAALGTLQDLIRLRAEPELHLLRGALLLRVGRREEALQGFRWAVQLPPRADGRRSLLGEALLGPGEWARLMASFRSASALAPPSARATLPGRSPLNAPPAPVFATPQPRPSGEALPPRRRALARAVSRLGRGLAAHGWLLWGRALANLRRGPLAIRSLRRAHRLAHPGRGAFLLLLLAALPNASSAAPRPDGPEARALVRLCLQSGPREGLEECRKAAAHATRRSGLLLRVLAWKLETAKRWDEAVEVYRTLVARHPGDPDALFRLGSLLLYAQDRPAEAEAPLRESLALRPEDAEAQGALAVALNLLGRFEESTEAFEETRRLDPEYLDRRPAAREIFEASGRRERWP